MPSPPSTASPAWPAGSTGSSGGFGSCNPRGSPGRRGSVSLPGKIPSDVGAHLSVSNRSSTATWGRRKGDRDGTRPPYRLGALALWHPGAPGERPPGARRPASALSGSGLTRPPGSRWALGAHISADGGGLVLRLEARRPRRSEGRAPLGQRDEQDPAGVAGAPHPPQARESPPLRPPPDPNSRAQGRGEGRGNLPFQRPASSPLKGDLPSWRRGAA